VVRRFGERVGEKAPQTEKNRPVEKTRPSKEVKTSDQGPGRSFWPIKLGPATGGRKDMIPDAETGNAQLWGDEWNSKSSQHPFNGRGRKAAAATSVYETRSGFHADCFLKRTEKPLKASQEAHRGVKTVVHSTTHRALLGNKREAPWIRCRGVKVASWHEKTTCEKRQGRSVTVRKIKGEAETGP